VTQESTVSGKGFVKIMDTNPSRFSPPTEGRRQCFSIVVSQSDYQSFSRRNLERISAMPQEKHFTVVVNPRGGTRR
jgi:hypothetical protein